MMQNTQVRGPVSALTSFLQSHNISAAEIRNTTEERRRHIEEQRALREVERATKARANEPVTASESEKNEESEASEQELTDPFASTDNDEKVDPKGKGKAVVGRPRSCPKSSCRKAQPKGKEKGKAKGKRKRGDDSDDTNNDFLDGGNNCGCSDCINGINLALCYNHNIDQYEECEKCNKTFKVTPYSLAGPHSSLLCTPCGKKAKSASYATAARRRAAAITRQRRKDIMDGNLIFGVKPLTATCLDIFVQNMHLAETLESLPKHLIDKVSKITSKRRMLTRDTLPLFVRRSTKVLYIYDAAKLMMEDLMGAFTTCTKLEELLVRNAIMLKDETMQLLVESPAPLTHVTIHGANLLSTAAWESLLRVKGNLLEALVIEYTDTAFNDSIAFLLHKYCPKLKHLSIRHNPAITNEGLSNLAQLTTLTSLSLELTNKEITPNTYADVIRKLGPNLESLSIRQIGTVDNDEILHAITGSCTKLWKLRLTEAAGFSDAGFANMFTTWKNQPLRHLDLFRCRGIDEFFPLKDSEFEELPVLRPPPTIGDLAIKAIFKHSADTLRYLNIVGARHITREGFHKALDGIDGFPELKYAELSFCAILGNEEVERFVLGAKMLRQIVVFGCLLLTSELDVGKTVQVVGMSNMRTDMGMW